MSQDHLESHIVPSEALAAGVSIIPPIPAGGPLATTSKDVGGVETKDNGSPLSPSEAIKGDEQIEALPKLVGLDTSDHVYPPPNTETSLSGPPLSTVRLVLLCAIVTGSFGVASGAQQALTIALPTIQTDLNMRQTDLQWLSSASALTNACFLLLAGRMADVHGRKKVFICGVAWSALWNLIGGFMKTGVGLVVTRAFSGSGVAMR